MIYEKEADRAGVDKKRLSEVLSKLSSVMRDLSKMGLSCDDEGNVFCSGGYGEEFRDLVLGSFYPVRFESGTKARAKIDGFMMLVEA